MPIPILSALDLNHIESQNLRLHNYAGEPSASLWGTGGLYFDSTALHVKYSTGTEWIEIYKAVTTNTANTVVLRDGSGNFAAGTITGNLTGNASTATALANSRNFSITGKATASAVGFTGAANVALDVTALSVAVGDIALTNGYFIVGNGSNVGAATAKASVPLSGFGAAAADVSMGGFKLTSVADPVNPQDAATKAYVDATSVGLNVLDAVRVGTTANITLSGTQTIDEVAVVAGDRVLVKDQTTQSQNGLYVCAAGAWSRSTDFDSSAEADPGSFVFVEEGGINAGSGWVMTAVAPVTLGTTAITWAQFSGAGTISAGNGIVKVGSTIYFAQSTSYTANRIPYATGTTTIGFSNTPSSAQLLQANGSGVPTFVTMSGHATMAAGGAVTIASSVVTTAMMASITGLSVLGNSGSAPGGVGLITGEANKVLRVDSAGFILGFGAINLASSSAVTGILPYGNGGTSNAYFQVSGPASSVKTYTFRNASSTIPSSVTGSFTGDGTTTTFDMVHNLGTKHTHITVYDNSTDIQVIVETKTPTLQTDRAVATFAQAPAVGAVYRWVAIG